jgi:hypothetical protein
VITLEVGLVGGIFATPVGAPRPAPFVRFDELHPSIFERLADGGKIILPRDWRLFSKSRISMFVCCVNISKRKATTIVPAAITGIF